MGQKNILVKIIGATCLLLAVFFVYQVADAFTKPTCNPPNCAGTLQVVDGSFQTTLTNGAMFKVIGGGISLDNAQTLNFKSTSAVVTQVLKLANDNSIIIGDVSSVSHPLRIHSGTSPTLSVVGGNVGIGTTAPTAQLHLNTVAGTNAFVIGSTTTQFIVNSTGNVGIGTTNPTYKLQVNGAFDATTITQGGVPVGGGGWTDGTNTVYVTNTADKVGIGMTNPTTTLDVNGTLNVGISAGASFSATGGTITYSDGYTIHAFTTTGQNFTPNGDGNVEVLVVGGGGGGGHSGGGGGGAGGYVYSAANVVTAQAYAVTIGAGGAVGSATVGSDGGNSSFNSLTAIGGGGGGSYSNVAGRNGGSGGGGGAQIGAKGTGTAGQGSDGGTAITGTNYAAAGGGGAMAAGQNTQGSNIAGDGGAGKEFSQFNAFGSAGWFAGGGGGGVNGNVAPNDYGTGGTGGGGRGGGSNADATYKYPTSGTANTGGGGGGKNGYSDNNGQGNGGSGIVIIRYLTGGTSATDTLITTTDGQVGIGATSPDTNYRLTVGLSTLANSGLKAETSSASQPAGYFNNGSTGPSLVTGTGKVGIGTTNPGAKLDVRRVDNSAGDAIAFGTQSYYMGRLGEDASVNLVYLGNTYNSDTSYIDFRLKGVAQGNSKMIITGTGNVGIGTTNPAGKLEVQGTGTVLSGTGYYNFLDRQDGSTGRGVLMGYDTSGQIGMISAAGASGNLAFWTHNGSAWGERVRINSTGNVGIGTTNPREKLEVVGNVIINNFPAKLFFNQPDGQSVRHVRMRNEFSNGFYPGVVQFNTDLLDTNDASNAGIHLSLDGSDTGFIGFTTQNSERVRINAAGNVGIASTTPWGLLSVNPNGITGPAFVVGSSTATNFIVDNGGNVGVGTASVDTNYKITTSGGGIKAENNHATNPAGYFDNLGAGPDIELSAGGIKFSDSTTQTTAASAGHWTVNGDAIYPDVSGISIGTHDFYYGVNVEGAGIASGVYGHDADTGWMVDLNGIMYGSKLAVDKYKINTDGDSFLNGGNVGINTTAPGTKLDINGNTYVRGTNFDASTATPAIDVQGAFIRIGDSLSSQTFTNGLGIKFHDSGSAHASIKYTTSAAPYRLDFCDSSANGALDCNTINNPSFSMTLPPGGGGSLGIGTTAPAQRLHIAGSGVNAQIGDSGGAALYFSGTSNNISVNSNQFQFNTTQTQGFTFNGGNVGIGTANPLRPLVVVDNGSGNTIDLLSNSPTAVGMASIDFFTAANRGWSSQIYNDTNGTLQIYTGGAAILGFAQNASGKVGIGLTDPDANYKLTVGTQSLDNSGIKVETNNATDPALYVANAGAGAAIKVDTGKGVITAQGGFILHATTTDPVPASLVAGQMWLRTDL